MILKKHLAQKPKRDVDSLPLGKPNRTNAFCTSPSTSTTKRID